MTGRAIVTWPVALAASAAVHVGAGAILVAALAPEAVTQQPVPESRMELAAYDVDRTTAEPTAPDADVAREGQPDAAAIGADAVPQSRADPSRIQGEATPVATPGAAPARPVVASGAAAPAVATDPVVAAAQAPAAVVIPDSAPSTATIPDSAPTPATIPDSTPDAPAIAGIAPDTAALTGRAAPTSRLSAASASAPALEDRAPATSSVASARPDAPALPGVAATAETVGSQRPQAATLADAPPTAQPAVAGAITAERQTALAAGSIVLADARPSTAAIAPAAPVATVALAPARDGATPLAAAVVSTPVSAPAPVQTAAAVASTLAAPSLAAAIPDAAPAPSAATPRAEAAAATAPERLDLQNLPAPAESAASVVAPAQQGQLATATGETAATAAPRLQVVPQSRANAPGLPAATPDTDRMTAELAYSGDADLDEVALKTLESFMVEGNLQSSGEVKDGIARLLSRVDCARLQAAYLPDTGALELRGHIPDETAREPLLAVLQAQVGAGIPVTDNMLILPEPQCGALSGIAAVGLPQSTDQASNPRLIGPDAHAQVYRFNAGHRLIFDMVAPDYDAFVYVDYFDADGNVIHLVPNERVRLERFPAEQTFRIGADRADGNFLAVQIGPPYGQEIAVAFAASVPLYEPPRPLVEPAGPYLDFLRLKVAEARASTPDFKGEWVYFFVATRP